MGMGFVAIEGQFLLASLRSTFRLGIVVPSGFVMSAIVITRKYRRTVFALLNILVVIRGIWVNASMIDESPSRCSGGDHARSIHSEPFISDSR